MLLLKLEPDGSGVGASVVYFRKGRVMKNHHSTCVHRDGFLYGYDDNVLRCVDLRKGEVSRGLVRPGRRAVERSARGR